MSPERVVFAKDGSPAAIAKAFEHQAEACRWGPLGPIKMEPIYIPGRSARVAQPSPPALTTLRASSNRASKYVPKLVVAGIAARYGVYTRYGQEWHRIVPGAFAPLGIVQARFNHFESVVIGSTIDRTLLLADGADALRFAIDLESPAAHKWGVCERLTRRNIIGASIRHTVRPDDAHEDGGNRYAIAGGKLIEVSLIERGLVPIDQGTSASLEFGCRNCWTHGLIGFVHVAADRIPRCRQCGMRHEG
ncbi:MAG: hypothetical protein A3H95_16825 [Acidobacteria bacterium RIFCSPLOWO2_02_FULL_64_15]|nr:MAG: hypothetical protein A3H95_16825 [Acidobacteria bacterium RIFCSPLOWO2_02_FULL_64_15]